MKIYVDFDDVICETAVFFTKIAKDLFDIDLPYSEVQFFNLKKTFNLNDEQYDELMKAGHIPENLLSYEETKGASSSINSLIDKGHEVCVITGRPFEAYEASRTWLDNHNLKRVPLYCVDKYGRESFNSDCSYSLSLEEWYGMDFDIAVEDSPAAYEHLLHFNGIKVAVFKRPWNINEAIPNESFKKFNGWDEILEFIEGLE